MKSTSPTNLTIVLTGGGTGGHITPIRAVARELKRRDPGIRIIYIGERHGKFADILAGNPDIDETYHIFAGKFRRYHGESWLRRLSDISTNLRNLRDFFFVWLGLIQSWRLLGRLRPDVILLKGGYVGMPVGLAAALRRQKFVTHDSDALPGLANRLVARWAIWHATGQPASFYRYPPASVKHVGVLVGAEYQPVTTALMNQYRRELDLPVRGQLLFVTGGSLGARAINLAMVRLAPRLLENYPELTIIHQVGRHNRLTYGEFIHPRLQVLEFVEGMHRYSGAADLIMTRAGANTLAEFGVQGKACIVVPNPRLTGGHQLKNAQYLQQQQAVVVVDEADLKLPEALEQVLADLLSDRAARRKLGQNLQALTLADAAGQLAVLLIDTAHAKQTKNHT